jgi:acyl carrier protein
MDRDDIKTKLREFICCEVMRRPDYPLADDEPLITGGLIDSMSLAQIGVFIEQKIQVYIPDSELTADRMDTLDRIADRILEVRR